MVQNPDGTLTMVFAGYRLPKTITTAGTVLGTNPSAPVHRRGHRSRPLPQHPGRHPDLGHLAGGRHRRPSVTASPADPVAGQPVTYTATVAVPAPGTGTPTGTVTLQRRTPGTLCSAARPDPDSPDTATCTTTYTGGAQTDP